MKNEFGKFGVNVFSQPSKYYAVIYLILIFLFPGIYLLFVKDFYHSTIQYERATEERFKELEGDLQKEFTNRLEERCPSKHRDAEVREVICTQKISEYKISFNEGKIIFRIHFTGKDLVFGDGITTTIVRGETRLGEWGDKPIFITEIDPIFMTEFPKNAKLFRSVLSIVFGRNLDYLSPHTYGGTFTPSIYSDFIKYNELTAGFSSSLVGVGGYFRFLYFSVVTQTTLGYGDIVPLTNRARFWVGLQSLLGIVLIGLFLNSVAKRSD